MNFDYKKSSGISDIMHKASPGERPRKRAKRSIPKNRLDRLLGLHQESKSTPIQKDLPLSGWIS